MYYACIYYTTGTAYRKLMSVIAMAHVHFLTDHNL